MFIQVIRARAKDAPGLRKEMDRWASDLMPGAEGFLGSTAGVTDDGEFVALARFDSEEAARRNSERPEQDKWYREFSEHLEGEVKFYDCAEAQTYLDGGSDEAGFVQIMLGRATDRDEMDRVMRDEEGQRRLRELRPDLIGGLFMWRDESHFVEAAYFPSEAEARRGERRMQTASEADRREFEKWQSLVEDLTYLDLRDPWLVSR